MSTKCEVKDCYEINSPARAAQLEDGAHYAHEFANLAHRTDSSECDRERDFARKLESQAEAMWDHLNRFHADDLKNYYGY